MATRRAPHNRKPLAAPRAIHDLGVPRLQSVNQWTTDRDPEAVVERLDTRRNPFQFHPERAHPKSLRPGSGARSPAGRVAIRRSRTPSPHPSPSQLQWFLLKARISQTLTLRFCSSPSPPPTPSCLSFPKASWEPNLSGSKRVSGSRRFLPYLGTQDAPTTSVERGSEARPKKGVRKGGHPESMHGGGGALHAHWHRWVLLQLSEPACKSF